MTRVEVTCRCPAYKFPHRHGSGKCSGGYAICKGCAQECNEVRRDFGYGPYEYGSERGVHHAWANVSDCCEAEVYKVSEDTLIGGINA